jgi:putative transposase
VTAFRPRSLAHTRFLYLFLYATYHKARVDGRVVSRAVVIATGVGADGGRERLGLDVGDSEDDAFWTVPHGSGARVHPPRKVLACMPRGPAEMVAAATRTTFAQPAGAEVWDQVDKVAAHAGPEVPGRGHHAGRRRQGLTAFAAFPTAPLERVDKKVFHHSTGRAECRKEVATWDNDS